MIDVASAYGRSNRQIETAFRNDLRYLNKGKAQQFLNTVSLLQESEAPNNSAKSPALVSDFISDAELSSSNIKTESDLMQTNLLEASKIVIRFICTKKGYRFLRSFGLQLPTWLDANGNLSKVNIKIENYLTQTNLIGTKKERY